MFIILYSPSPIRVLVGKVSRRRKVLKCLPKVLVSSQ